MSWRIQNSASVVGSSQLKFPLLGFDSHCLQALPAVFSLCVRAWPGSQAFRPSVKDLFSCFFPAHWVRVKRFSQDGLKSRFSPNGFHCWSLHSILESLFFIPSESSKWPWKWPSRTSRVYNIAGYPDLLFCFSDVGVTIKKVIYRRAESLSGSASGVCQLTLASQGESCQYSIKITVLS
jgi:hypothetical protein